MERLFEYLKRSLTIAWKSVFFNFKQYVSFFAALFIIQTFYGLIAVSNANNDIIEYQHVQNEYDYHMVLRDLNEDQYLYLVNNSAAVFKNDTIFKILRYDENRNYMTGQDRYDMYLFFVRDKDISCDRFYNKYLEPLKSLGREGESFVITETPLLRFEYNEQNNLATFIFTTLLLLAVSIFLLTALYNIRVNQYKFTYGVYMTFGADFKMLFGTAFWELFVISVVTLVPAVLVSTLAVYLIYLPSGFTFHFSLLAFLEVAIFNLAVVLVSVWMPMRVMAIRQPMTLIVTEDNSNLVTSPMRSINLMKGKFPTYYEFCSIWRFRKYSVQLLTTAIVFCALFICGLYYADIDERKLEYPRPQFTVDLSKTGFAYDEEMSADLYAIPGITEVKAVDNNIEAMEIASHMITSKDNVRPFSNQVIYKSESNPITNHRVTNEVLYTGLSEEQIRILEKYEYDGDLASIFTNPSTVIIGDSISNVPTYRFEVGDTIQIAIKT
ncbi:MAG: ABC transporter permease, partial [Clostridia bacterium]|nr:ABC transporter permease [Clostridia bacterium]